MSSIEIINQDGSKIGIAEAFRATTTDGEAFTISPQIGYGNSKRRVWFAIPTKPGHEFAKVRLDGKKGIKMGTMTIRQVE